MKFTYNESTIDSPILSVPPHKQQKKHTDKKHHQIKYVHLIACERIYCSFISYSFGHAKKTKKQTKKKLANAYHKMTKS